MEENDDSVSRKILRMGAAKRSRMLTDSRLSFRRYSLKMALMLSFIFIDGLLIPSAFQSLGLLSTRFIVPLGIVLIAVAATELRLLSRIR